MECPYCNNHHSDELEECPSTGKKLKKACTNPKCSYFGEYVFPLSATSCPCCDSDVSDKPDLLSSIPSSKTVIIASKTPAKICSTFMETMAIISFLNDHCQNHGGDSTNIDSSYNPLKDAIHFIELASTANSDELIDYVNEALDNFNQAIGFYSNVDIKPGDITHHKEDESVILKYCSYIGSAICLFILGETTRCAQKFDMALLDFCKTVARIYDFSEFTAEAQKGVRSVIAAMTSECWCSIEFLKENNVDISICSHYNKFIPFINEYRNGHMAHLNINIFRR